MGVDISALGNTFEPLRRLADYRAAVAKVVPDLPTSLLSTWTLSDADALLIWLLLDEFTDEVDVLDLGTFVGLSAFHYASHPRVRNVLSVDPNPPIGEEINDKKAIISDDQTVSDKTRVLDIARIVLEQFAEQQTRISLKEGVLGHARTLLNETEPTCSNVLTIPDGGQPLIAHIDALHTAEAVRDDLAAVFSTDRTVATVLDDCRYHWGPSVQAGVAAFLRERPEFVFQLAVDLAPTASALGMIYRPESAFAEAVNSLRRAFTNEWDVMRLLTREQELVAEISATRDELVQLRSAREMRRYRAADSVAGLALSIPGVRSLRDQTSRRA